MFITSTPVAPFSVDTARRCGSTLIAFINPLTTLINICIVSMCYLRDYSSKMPCMPVQKDDPNRPYPPLHSQWKDPSVLTHTWLQNPLGKSSHSFTSAVDTWCIMQALSQKWHEALYTPTVCAICQLKATLTVAVVWSRSVDTDLTAVMAPSLTLINICIRHIKSTHYTSLSISLPMQEVPSEVSRL